MGIVESTPTETSTVLVSLIPWNPNWGSPVNMVSHPALSYKPDSNGPAVELKVKHWNPLLKMDRKSVLPESYKANNSLPFEKIHALAYNGWVAKSAEQIPVAILGKYTLQNVMKENPSFSWQVMTDMNKYVITSSAQEGSVSRLLPDMTYNLVYRKTHDVTLSMTEQRAYVSFTMLRNDKLVDELVKLNYPIVIKDSTTTLVRNIDTKLHSHCFPVTTKRSLASGQLHLHDTTVCSYYDCPQIQMFHELPEKELDGLVEVTIMAHAVGPESDMFKRVLGVLETLDVPEYLSKQ